MLYFFVVKLPILFNKFHIFVACTPLDTAQMFHKVSRRKSQNDNESSYIGSHGWCNFKTFSRCQWSFIHTVDKIQGRLSVDKLVSFAFNMDFITNDNIQLTAWHQTESILHV